MWERMSKYVMEGLRLGEEPYTHPRVCKFCAQGMEYFCTSGVGSICCLIVHNKSLRERFRAGSFLIDTFALQSAVLKEWQV